MVLLSEILITGYPNCLEPSRLDIEAGLTAFNSRNNELRPIKADSLTITSFG